MDFEGTVGESLTLETGVARDISDERFRTGMADLDLDAPFPAGFVGVPDDFRVERTDLSAYAEATLRRTAWTIKGGLKWRGARFDLKDGDAAPFLQRRFDALDACHWNAI